MRFLTLLAVGLGFSTSPVRAQLVPTLAQPGYQWSVFYEEPMGNPTGLAFDPQGRLFLCTRTGTVRVLEDLNGDHVAETVTTFWSGTGITQPCSGILWLQGKLYISHAGTISSIEDVDNDLVGDVKVDLVTGLPIAMHQNNGIFTDGTFIYFGLGSTTDHDPETNGLSASLMRMNPDGTGLMPFATGLRNVFDGCVHPVTGDIFVGDNGPNYITGNPNPPEEINWVRAGLDYGHPQNWGIPPTGVGTEPPLLELVSHAAPVGMAVNPNTQISGYRHELVMVSFATGFGGVLRLPLIYGPISGLPGSWPEVFITGMQNAIDVEFGPGGEMYLAVFSNGRVYQVYHPTRTVITVESPSTIGTTATLTLSSPDHAGDFVIAAVSDALGPPISLWPIQLHLDVTTPFFAFANSPQTGIFSLPQPGLLDATGKASASVLIPNVPALVGLQVFFQCVVLDVQNPSIVLGASPPVALRVNPSF